MLLQARIYTFHKTNVMRKSIFTHRHCLIASVVLISLGRTFLLVAHSNSTSTSTSTSPLHSNTAKPLTSHEYNSSVAINTATDSLTPHYRGNSLPITSFVPWKQRKDGLPLPCIIDRQRLDPWNPFNHYSQNQPTDRGMLYIKIEKAASSTLASVAARTVIAIAERTQANATREDGTEAPRICRFRGMGHLWSKRSKNLLDERNRDHTFLWTFLKKHLLFLSY